MAKEPTEFERLLPAAPALQEIDRILGPSIAPEKKVELFRMTQRICKEVIARVIKDTMGR